MEHAMYVELVEWYRFHYQMNISFRLLLQCTPEALPRNRLLVKLTMYPVPYFTVLTLRVSRGNSEVYSMIARQWNCGSQYYAAITALFRIPAPQMEVQNLLKMPEF